MFYCMFYFTCDRCCTAGQEFDRQLDVCGGLCRRRRHIDDDSDQMFFDVEPPRRAGGRPRHGVEALGGGQPTTTHGGSRA